MARILVTLATLLALVIAAAFVAPAFIDWKSYKPDIERAASAILGRTIKIEGDVDIVLLPEPHFRATRVEAERSASDGAEMSADAVNVSLSLQALLAGRLEASRLTLLRPFLILDLSKRPQAGADRGKSASAIQAQVTSLEIEEGRVAIFQDAARPEVLTLTGLDGTFTAAYPGNSYRFNGRLSQGARRYDVRALAAPAANGLKLTGSALDLASKIAFQADGVLSASAAQLFEGAVAMSAPQSTALAGAPFEVQAKASAKIDLSGGSFSDLSLTVDADNRPQVMLGSATVAFAAGTADITLQARSLDADLLLAGGAPAIKGPAAEGSGKQLQSALSRLLWLYPEYGLRLSLAADQVQVRGELIEGAGFRGSRGGGVWAIDEAKATLPGETLASLSGSLTLAGGKTELSAAVAVEGKNLGRLNRWIAPPAANAKPIAARTFAAKGQVKLSDEAVALTDVAGDVGGTPFTASLNLERAPVRKLQLSLTGDSFDLRSFETAPGGTLSSQSLSGLWRGLLGQAAPFLGDGAGGLDAADIDIAAGAIKTSSIDAKKVSARLKFNSGLLTIAKLSFETPEGLALNGEGVVPLSASGLGRFDGRLEARSTEAVAKAAALLGFGPETLEGRRIEDLTPATLSISYGAEPQLGADVAQLSGSLGAARVQGKAQMKGGFADWRTKPFWAQIDLSAPDGNKLVALLFPKAGAVPGASAAPGAISVQVQGEPKRLETSFFIKAGALQAQFEGTSALKDRGLAFEGKASASSQTPELFLPAPLLALLGGEPRAAMRIETDAAFGLDRFDAAKIRAESPKNVVTGRLSIAAGDGPTRLDADLKADQLSLPSLLGYFLTQASSDRIPLSASAAAAVQSSDIWSGQPFAMSAFQDASAKVVLTAKTLTLSDTLALADARVAAALENSRLDVQRLNGKAIGGELAASLSLDAKSGALVGADMRLSLTNADLSALPIAGSPPIVVGKASLTLHASGQGLSPRGLITVLQGRGAVRLTDGQLSKISPPAVQKSAEDLLALPQPATEPVIKKKVFDAAQSADFKFRHLAIPVTIRDGMLEARRASFRSPDEDRKERARDVTTVRMEGFLDLTTMQADTSWQTGVSTDKRAKWPPVKLQVSGPLRELGAKQRSIAAEDFIRAVLIRKMEGDINRLESLNKPQAAVPQQASQLPAQKPWTATQESASKPIRRKRDEQTAPPAQAGVISSGPTDFEKRMRDALRARPDGQ